ncbi:MAG: DUF4280 domain-containing protein [Holosporales bacterium]|nr:DUF4280 domain-containing protein [Holosporales bacterium]
MPVVVCGAMCQCSFGLAPSSLIVIPKVPVFISNMPVGSIVDIIPMANIAPFGMCNSMANPMVAAATAAAFGVLTPMPCVPAISAPWITSKVTVLLPMGPILAHDSKCICMWGGSIGIIFPGQVTVS